LSAYIYKNLLLSGTWLLEQEIRWSLCNMPPVSPVTCTVTVHKGSQAYQPQDSCMTFCHVICARHGTWVSHTKEEVWWNMDYHEYKRTVQKKRICVKPGPRKPPMEVGNESVWIFWQNPKWYSWKVYEWPIFSWSLLTWDVWIGDLHMTFTQFFHLLAPYSMKKKKKKKKKTPNGFEKWEIWAPVPK
jgi:hypothetical protein